MPKRLKPTPVIISTGWAVGLAKGRYIVDGVAQEYEQDWNGPIPWDWFPKSPWPWMLHDLVPDGALRIAVFRTRQFARAHWAQSHPKGDPYHGAGRTKKITVAFFLPTMKRGRS